MKVGVEWRIRDNSEIKDILQDIVGFIKLIQSNWAYSTRGRLPYTQKKSECKRLQHKKKREAKNEMGG